MPPPMPLLTHVHSVVLAAAFTLTFPTLVAAPPATLLSTLVPLALLQSVYAILCLDPPAPPKRPSSTSPKRKKPASRESWTSKILPTILSLALSLSLGSTLLYAVLVAFGAPLTTHFLHTFGLAAHLALMVAFPLVARYGVDADKWREVVAVNADVEEAFAGAVGACVGAWLGAIPIPLDWDKEWQKWPVTILAGAYAGYLVGKAVGSLGGGLFNEKKKAA